VGGAFCYGALDGTRRGEGAWAQTGSGWCSWLASWAHTVLLSHPAPGWPWSAFPLASAFLSCSGWPGLRAELGQGKLPHFPRSLTWFPVGIRALGAGKRQSAQARAGHQGLTETLLVRRHCSIIIMLH